MTTATSVHMRAIYSLGLRPVRFFVMARAAALHPVLQLASRFVERLMGHDFRALDAPLVRPLVVDDELVTGKTDVDGDPEAIPMFMMVARQLDHYMTRDDVIVEILEVIDAPLDLFGERAIERNVS
jgi:hypothetical protein